MHSYYNASETIEQGGMRMTSTLRSKRLEKGLSQCDLYKKTNVGPWRISLLERGLFPQRDEAEKIAKVLDAPVNELFPTLSLEQSR
jgi:transcriptional regulator with XRE-family HTH domain